MVYECKACSTPLQVPKSDVSQAIITRCESCSGLHQVVTGDVNAIRYFGNLVPLTTFEQVTRTRLKFVVDKNALEDEILVGEDGALSMKVFTGMDDDDFAQCQKAYEALHGFTIDVQVPAHLSSDPEWFKRSAVVTAFEIINGLPVRTHWPMTITDPDGVVMDRASLVKSIETLETKVKSLRELRDELEQLTDEYAQLQCEIDRLKEVVEDDEEDEDDA